MFREFRFSSVPFSSVEFGFSPSVQSFPYARIEIIEYIEQECEVVGQV